jgi:hypothetical protein
MKGSAVCEIKVVISEGPGAGKGNGKNSQHLLVFSEIINVKLDTAGNPCRLRRTQVSSYDYCTTKYASSVDGLNACLVLMSKISLESCIGDI